MQIILISNHADENLEFSGVCRIDFDDGAMFLTFVDEAHCDHAAALTGWSPEDIGGTHDLLATVTTDGKIIASGREYDHFETTLIETLPPVIGENTPNPDVSARVTADTPYWYDPMRGVNRPVRVPEPRVGRARVGRRRIGV